MNFELSEVQRDIKSAAREFAEGEFPDLKAESPPGEFPRERWEKACELGFIGMDIPEEYGGPGFGILENILVVEEFHKVNPRIASAILSSGMGRRALLKFGTEKQKEKYLSQLAEGEIRMGTCPDVEEFQTHEFPSAEPDGERWTLSGEIEIRAEAVPEYILMLCLTPGEGGKAEEQFTHIILDLDRKKIEKETLTEGEKRPIHKVSLNGIEVSPEKNIIGKKGEGRKQVKEILKIGKIADGARALGISEGAFERSGEYLRERRNLGKFGWEYPGTRAKLAEIKTEIKAARNLLYEGGYKVDGGETALQVIDMARWKTGKVAVEAVSEAVRLHEGMWGHLEDYFISNFEDDAGITHRSPKTGSTRNLKTSQILYKGIRKYENILKEER